MTWIMLVGTKGIVEMEYMQLDRNVQMHGVFMICQETFGSGALIK